MKTASRGSAATTKPHRGEAFWRSALERQRGSGVARREFCEREGLALSTFTLWSKRLGSGSHSGSESQFVEVTPLVTSALPGSAEPLQIRLHLGGGIVLEIVRG